MDYNSKGLMIIPAICFILVVVNLNRAIKDFFLDGFVIFVVTTLVFYKSNRNIVLSLAEGFLATILVKIITLQDPVGKMKENYEKFIILMPNSNSKISCNNMKKADLISKFGGDEEKLKYEMYIKGVPENIQITDENSPTIATYLELC